MVYCYLLRDLGTEREERDEHICKRERERRERRGAVSLLGVISVNETLILLATGTAEPLCGVVSVHETI